jgi:hypothetical protein
MGKWLQFNRWGSESLLLTVQSSVIRLHMGLLDLAILYHEGVPLASGTSEYSGSIKGEV